MPEKRLKFIFAGGGTGGHLYPAIALAQELEKRGVSDILFIGTAYGIENKIMKDHKYKFKKIWMRGLQRKLSMGNILFPLRLLVSLVQSIVIVLTFKPDAIIGTGGYVSGPALMAGIVLGIPTIIQEQNSYPGLVNRLLGKKVAQVHLTFEDSVKYFEGQKDIKLSGNPVRELGKVLRSEACKKFSLDESKAILLVFGGSQGARAINSAVLSGLSEFNNDEMQILWATGPGEYERISTQVTEINSGVRVLPYLDDMASAYAAADFALCRAGASTLSEIAVCGLPSILVPYPFAAANHQDFNAHSVEKSGAAIVISEKKLNKENLKKAVNELLNNSDIRTAMREAALRIAKPDATKEIIEHVLSLIEEAES